MYHQAPFLLDYLDADAWAGGATISQHAEVPGYDGPPQPSSLSCDACSAVLLWNVAFVVWATYVHTSVLGLQVSGGAL